ncbi:GNAT family N-acetyltransferase [Streptomyces zagrosensis]|uniref:GNAT superfamily N-acetyltransferase n=1 Tax=Streptomyces zagrosensis TaxID=1042984 RepID=A0A7W9UVR7_9ACTN|nr:GNAT family N-acetyltransferase [Streptomyces zagrosensis]MBB5933105.1 GNAT superfamily N-acetyltransferase [Streptomyces zagrosensis]
MSIRTSVVPVAEIFHLRWSVLRPGLPREAANYPQDGLAGVFHVAAYAEAAPDGAVPPGPLVGRDPLAGPGRLLAADRPLACMTAFPSPLPAAATEITGPVAGAEAGACHQFRGLASDPAVRGQGYGVAVLRAGLAEAAARGARWAWCNGRTGARGFYEREGFTAVGEEFDLAPSGRHLIFVSKL